MNKLRPYFFWIICGVVVLIELLLLLFFSPSEGDKTPEGAKQEVDGAKKKLDAMAKQAAHAPPPNQIFDPLVKADIDDLTKTYLATQSWKQPLIDELQRYSDQLTKIKDHLLKRSKMLHEKISTEQTNRWYEAYAQSTAALLQKLYEAGCLKLPRAGGVPGMPSSMSGGVPGGVGSETQVRPGNASPDAADPKPDFNGDGALRSVAGFKTMQKFEDIEYDELTLHYHMMDTIAGVLEGASAANLPSPAALNKKPVDSRVKLFKTSFNQESGNDENVHVVTIDLEGPLSALLAAEAALEENKDGEQAVRAVIGGRLFRPAYGGDEALHVSSEPLDLELQIAFLDFTDLTNISTDVMPQLKSATKAPPPPPAHPPAPRTAGDEGGS